MALAQDASRRSNKRTPFEENLDEQIGTVAGELTFDPVREREARTGFIEQQTQQSRERLGRQFALTPSGVQQGRAISRFAGLEGQQIGRAHV